MRYLGIIILVCVSACVAACGGDGGSPTSPSSNTPQSLAITGCGLAEGGQCKATATYGGGRTADVTSQVAWSTSNPAVCGINATGVLQPVSDGTFDVIATVQGVTGRTTVQLTMRRFLVEGLVRETTPTDTVAIPGATVEVVNGPNAGMRTAADGNGYYVLNELTAGTFTIKATAPNFSESTSTVSLTGNRVANLHLTPSPRQITETVTGFVSGGSTPSVRRVRGHHGGLVSVRLDWDNDRTDLDLELWQGGNRLARSADVRGRSERVSSSVSAAEYEIRVIYYTGATGESYRLTIERPY